jgi:hypothetical protein
VLSFQEHEYMDDGGAVASPVFDTSAVAAKWFHVAFELVVAPADGGSGRLRITLNEAQTPDLDISVSPDLQGTPWVEVGPSENVPTPSWGAHFDNVVVHLE